MASKSSSAENQHEHDFPLVINGIRMERGERGQVLLFADEPDESELPKAETAIAGYTASFDRGSKTWTIHDVPVFSVHVDDRHEEPENYDLAWLLSAVEVGKAREKSDGYLEPQHTQHNPSPEVTFAGKFRLTVVRSLNYEGVATPTIYADLVEIPDEQYQAIKGGNFPYRSVEIVGPEKPEILSLALLDHEVPYFRYANMRIAKESKGSKRSLVACRAFDLDGRRTQSVTFEFPEGLESTMVKTFDSKFDSKACDLCKKKKPGSDSGACDDCREEQNGLDMNGNPFANDDDPEEKTSEDDAEKEKDPEAKKFNAGALIEQIMALMAELASALADDSTDASEDVVDVEAPVTAANFADTETIAPASDTEAALRGEIAAMKIQLDAIRETAAAASETTELERAASAFAEQGAPKKDVEEFKRLSTAFGLAAGRSFASSMANVYASIPAAPPSGAFTGDLRIDSVFPPEVMAFRNDGPEKFEEAKRVFTTWQASSRVHPLSTYLDAHLNESKFFVAPARS